MKTIITSLPHATNDGRPTGYERGLFFAKLATDGVSYSVATPSLGFWYADDGTLYSEAVTLVYMQGSETAIRAAVAAFGEAAGQLEMLFVEKHNGCILASGRGKEAAAKLAKQYGGATLTPNGIAISLDYASLVAGVDYSAESVVR